MKTLYLTDLDGTLLNSDKKVSDKSAQIINNLTKKGMLFSIATARSQGSIKGLIDNLELNMPIILLNGVFIYDTKNKINLNYHSLDNSTAYKILDVFLEHNKSPFMYLLKEDGIDLNYTDLKLDVHKAFYEKRRELFDFRFYKVENYNIPDESEVVYFNLIDFYEELKPICDKLRKIDGVSCAFYHDNYSDYWFLEVYSNKASKKSGALYIKEYCKADRIVAFGDNHNDKLLFDVADECYATANAVDDLKAIATQVIGANDEDGVANKLLEKYNHNQL